MTEEPLQQDTGRRRNRRSLVLIAVIAIVPMAMAYAVLYLFPQLIPKGTTNKGTLVSPAISMDKLSDSGLRLPRGKWMLVMSAGADCDRTCNHALYLARQANIALGKDASRVERLLLVSGNSVSQDFQDLLAREYPHMLVQYLAAGSVQATLGHLSSSGSLDGYIFMADPKGYVMMVYSPGNTGKDILADLKHLLGVSG